jgi:hypothetical protein
MKSFLTETSRFGLPTLTLCLCALGSIGTAKADITYNIVPETLGPWTVTGTITTDGKIGTLTAGDIVSWALTAEGSGVMSPTFALSSPTGSVDVEGVSLAASTSELLFDMGATDAGLFAIFSPLEGGRYIAGVWVLATMVDDFGWPWGELVAIDNWGFTGTSNEHNHAFVVGQAAVPEPSSVILLLTMLVAVAFVTRKRIAQGL